jgi:RNA polymerase sigma-70 factor (ECF subfamily)
MSDRAGVEARTSSTPDDPDLDAERVNGERISDFFLAGGPALLRRFRRGDRDALEQVYHAYVDAVARVVAFSLKRFGSNASSQVWWHLAGELPDLVQEAFTHAFNRRSREQFDGARPYGPYLCRISRNVVIDFLRRTSRYVPARPTLDFDAALQLSSPSDGGDALADVRAMAIVATYVRDLPSDLRIIHEALYVSGLSQRQAANELGVGRQVIRTLEARLKEGLRAVIDEPPR